MIENLKRTFFNTNTGEYLESQKVKYQFLALRRLPDHGAHWEIIACLFDEQRETLIDPLGHPQEPVG